MSALDPLRTFVFPLDYRAMAQQVHVYEFPETAFVVGSDAGLHRTALDDASVYDTRAD
jgi:hypothetical protein